jgi:Pentapeptide repeats (9 copies)
MTGRRTGRPVSTCCAVTCACPTSLTPGQDAPEPERLAFAASREVRHTAIRAITARLKDGATVPWQGLNFDFTGVVFDGGDFRHARFSGGTVDFRGARFSGGEVNFGRARFSGGAVDFSSPGH